MPETPLVPVAPPDRDRDRLYVACQLGGWGLWTILYIALAAAPGDVVIKGEVIDTRPTVNDLATILLTNCVGLLLTHLYRTWIRRRGWLQLPWTRLLPRALGAVPALALLWTALLWPAMHYLRGAPRLDVRISDFTVGLYSVFNGTVFLFLWSALYFGYHVFARFRRSEVERWRLQSTLKEAELRAFKSQVNPHFIFNSLNSLRALIDEDPARARAAVTQLANLLRYALQAGQLETVSLEDELRVVNDYLALEQVRHEDRLRVRLDVSAEAAACPVPPMLVQTLVENAVKYGIAARREGGEIAILGRCSATGLRLRVTNPGSLAPPAPGPASTGMGLRNAAERLRLLFGEAARLQLREESPGLVVAEVEVPAHVRRTDARPAPAGAVS